LLSRRENLTLDGKRALRTLLAANKRLNTAARMGAAEPLDPSRTPSATTQNFAATRAFSLSCACIRFLTGEWPSVLGSG
jgi:hypothetical protein